MAQDTCPAMLMITSSPAPPSASSVTRVWRLSCHRPFTPAFSRTLIHAVLNEVMGRVGSAGDPKANTNHSGLHSPNRRVYQAACASMAAMASRCLLFLEDDLLIQFAHAAREVAVDGKRFAVRRECPLVLHREVTVPKLAFGFEGEGINVPFNDALHFGTLEAGIGAFLAVGSVEVAHLAGHLDSHGEHRFEVGDFLGHAGRRGPLAEVALAGVEFPGRDEGAWFLLAGDRAAGEILQQSAAFASTGAHTKRMESRLAAATALPCRCGRPYRPSLRTARFQAA